MAEITMVINGEQFAIDDDPQKFTAEELMAVEQHTGMLVVEWASKLMDERISTQAWTALAWIAVRRANRPIRWDDFARSVSVMDLIQSMGTRAAALPDPPAVVPNRADRRAKKPKPQGQGGQVLVPDVHPVTTDGPPEPPATASA
jgi:hypothetical protein